MEVIDYYMKVYGKLDATIKVTCDCGNTLSGAESINELEYIREDYHQNFLIECDKCKKTYAVMFVFSHKMKPFKSILLGTNLDENEKTIQYEEWIENTYDEWSKVIEGGLVK